MAGAVLQRDRTEARAEAGAEGRAGAAEAWRPRQADAALLEELEAANARLEGAAPEEIVQWAAARFGNGLTMATAFGPEGMVILELLSRLGPQTDLFNLDTGYQFAETLALREQVRQRYGLQVRLERAEETVEQFEARHGGPLYKTDPNACCFQRKILVLRRAIEGKQAWISAIRRDQSPDRRQAPIVGWDAKFGLAKVNPLANWSRAQVWKRIVEAQIPYNPLHDQGYTSIGCWPCTRAVQFGEDERAGRWSGTAKTECGLHALGGDA